VVRTDRGHEERGARVATLVLYVPRISAEEPVN